VVTPSHHDGASGLWSTSRPAEIVVVVDEHRGQPRQGGAQVGQGPRIAGDQTVRRHIVPTLGDAHGDPLVAALGAADADEAQDHRVALVHGVGEQSELGPHRIREDRLGDEALALTDELGAQGIGGGGGLAGGEAEVPGQHIGVDPAQARRREMGVEKRRLARPVGARQNHQHWPPAQQGRQGCRFRHRW
jgi:hypothetical protein